MTLKTIPEKVAERPMVVYRGAPGVPVYTNSRSEFKSLVSGCGVYDVAWRATIRLTGGDRVRWLNGMVTNNVRDLVVGRGAYAFLLNPQGHILADLYAFNRGNHLLVATDQSQLKKIVEIFDHYIIMDDVEVADASERVVAIGLAGPEARNVLERCGLKIPQLEPLQIADLGWQGVGVTVIRGDNPRVDTYEFQVRREDAGLLRDAPQNAGASPVGTQALEMLRIASGVPLYGLDIRERDLPQETEQTRALHFSKGCYVGQEIVERIRSRGAVHRRFTGFRVDGDLPQAGARVLNQGKDIGEITSTTVLPTARGDFHAALGYVRRESSSAGTEVEVGGGRAVITDIPFAAVFEN